MSAAFARPQIGEAWQWGAHLCRTDPGRVGARCRRGLSSLLQLPQDERDPLAETEPARIEIGEHCGTMWVAPRLTKFLLGGEKIKKCTV